MAIVSNEIKFYASTSNLGGVITSTEIYDFTTHNLFDLVEGAGSSFGETNYRCIYVKNTNSSAELINASIHLVTGTTVSTTDMYIGLGTSIIGGVEQAIVLETDTPVGVTFSNLVGEVNKLVIGNIPKGSHKAIWFKRVISPNTPAYTSDQVTIRVQGGST